LHLLSLRFPVRIHFVRESVMAFDVDHDQEFSALRSAETPVARSDSHSPSIGLATSSGLRR
jgi:hypothetical protein